jgi:hypothetical protein
LCPTPQLLPHRSGEADLKKASIAIAAAIAGLGVAGQLVDGRVGGVLTFCALLLLLGAFFAVLMTVLDRKLSGDHVAMRLRPRRRRSGRCGLCGGKLTPSGRVRLCPDCDQVSATVGDLR